MVVSRKEQNKRNLNRITHGQSQTKEYKAWQDAQRMGCDWLNYEEFIDDMGKAPPKHILSRIDKSKPFNKTNCQWVTSKKHTRNRKSNHKVTINKETKVATDWAIAKKLPPGVVIQRLTTYGYSADDCIKPKWEIWKTKIRRGPANNRWNPNLTDEDRQARDFQRLQLKDWSIKVLVKDNYTCQVCNKRGGVLNAHHIDSWDIFPEKRFDISNGATLCRKCHLDFHNDYGFGKNTRSQFDMFSHK